MVKSTFTSSNEDIAADSFCLDMLEQQLGVGEILVPGHPLVRDTFELVQGRERIKVSYGEIRPESEGEGGIQAAIGSADVGIGGE